jgi:hypothetical protein
VVQISYTVTVDTATTGPLANTAVVTHNGTSTNLTATLLANPLQGFLPVARR